MNTFPLTREDFALVNCLLETIEIHQDIFVVLQFCYIDIPRRRILQTLQNLRTLQNLKM